MAKRTKQQHILDMAPPSSPKLEDAADAFMNARNAWQSKHKPMMDARAEVERLMHELKLTTYEFNRDGVDYVVQLDTTEKVKVKTKKREEANGDDS